MATLSSFSFFLLSSPHLYPLLCSMLMPWPTSFSPRASAPWKCGPATWRGLSRQLRPWASPMSSGRPWMRLMRWDVGEWISWWMVGLHSRLIPRVASVGSYGNLINSTNISWQPVVWQTLFCVLRIHEGQNRQVLWTHGAHMQIVNKTLHFMWQRVVRREVQGLWEAEGASEKMWWCEIYKESFLGEGGDEKRKQAKWSGRKEINLISVARSSSWEGPEVRREHSMLRERRLEQQRGWDNDCEVWR